MKKIFSTVVTVILASTSIQAQKNACAQGITLSQNYSKATQLQSIMDSGTVKGIPGISLALYSPTEGWWAGVSGYSKLESKKPMNICTLQYLQSVAKTYMAVAILQLYEERKIQLHLSITKYLPVKYIRFIKNADKITVRMLLNHTFGNS